jgi:hypothetical protein
MILKDGFSVDDVLKTMQVSDPMDFEKLVRGFQQMDPDTGAQFAREKASYIKWQLKSLNKDLSYENIYHFLKK